MSAIIEVEGHRFVCDTEIEKWRAKTLLEKEAGTVKWLRREARRGDVLWDIGANIGLYTIVAAKLGAFVYAFEPHIANAASLMRNVLENNLGDRVQLITCALHSEVGWLPFNYASPKAGSSGHQLGHTTDERGKQFLPAIVEMKYAEEGDRLWRGFAKAPTLVKIDVDGNEKKVLVGMREMLNVAKPRNVQVEIHPNNLSDIVGWMAVNGYPDAGRHDTLHGKELMRKGVPAADVAHNAIFRIAA